MAQDEIIENIFILLVDDAQENLLGLESLLEAPGRNFLKATNGKDAVKIALSQPVDLLILDVNMPGMDGYEVAEVLQSNSATSGLPIIFVTAMMRQHEDIMKGFSEGATDYLIKPLDPQITRSKVDALLKIITSRKSAALPLMTEGEQHIFIKSGARYVKINYLDVLWLEAEGDYVVVHCTKEKHIVHATMKVFESKLPASQFIRIHRSYIVTSNPQTNIAQQFV